MLSKLRSLFGNVSVSGKGMDGKLRIGILLSGKGSNLLALVNEILLEKNYPAKIVCVITDNINESKEVLDIVSNRLNIHTYSIDYYKCNSKEHFFAEIQQLLIKNDVEFICLAGFMRLLPKSFLKAWSINGSDRCLATRRNWLFASSIINIHPSLLPLFPGLHAPKRALDSGVKFTGCTIHFVNEGMDTGIIIAQGIVPIKKRDTEATLIERIQKAEHYYYKQVIRLIAEDKILFSDTGKAILEDNLIHSFNIVYPNKITQLDMEI